MKKIIRKTLRVDRETALLLAKLKQKLGLSENAVIILSLKELGKINDIK